MRLSLLETGFWIGNALRAAGLPYGASSAAVRMAQWAEAFHGIGWTLIERRCGAGRGFDAPPARIVAEDPRGATIDAGGQSSLLLGPGALDLVCAKAHGEGAAAATIADLRDLAFLGQLCGHAARRGFLACLAFRADEAQEELHDLAALYGPGRGIVALPVPGREAPLWIELPRAPEGHGLIQSGAWRDLSPADLGAAFLAPAPAAAPGVTLAVAAIPEGEVDALARALRELAARHGAEVHTPEDVAATWRRVLEQGFEVDDARWESLARFALSAVVPSSEASRDQAGADG
jgi:LDH2 family malate/lactate/ureidoglycolate dehydrogenase